MDSSHTWNSKKRWVAWNSQDFQARCSLEHPSCWDSLAYCLSKTWQVHCIFRGQSILPFNLPIESLNNFIHLGFKRQSPLHTLFEFFSMNSYECISMANATNGIKSHHRNDNILNTLVIIKVVTFNKLPSFWKVVECVVYIFQINFFW
jgi:hypothetical protein